ncbi:MAG: rod shape-determining protein MreC [Gemmatimonadaceae bacterium]
MARAARTASQLDTGLVLACGLLAVLALVMPDRLRESAATAIRRSILAPLVSMQQRAEVLRGVIVARDSVQRRVAAATGLQLTAPELASENSQLRAILGLGSRLGHGFISAEALQTESFDRDYTLTVSAGSDAGVERFTPVVTADGLVGQVQQVDATMSFVITWAHPQFAVSAMDVDQTAFGIVRAHLGTGAERWLLEMTGVAFRHALKNGTLIVSTGMGKTYPRGIPIGTVFGEIQTTEKWSRTYLLKPAVLPNTPGPVLLMIPSRSPRDVNHVWTSLVSADSAARGIVAAGDSIARKNALAELAARRAALDSAALDSAYADSVTRTGGVPPAVRPRVDTTKKAVPRDTTKKIARPDTARIKPPTGPPPPLRFDDETSGEEQAGSTSIVHEVMMEALE